jgi:hypothetical protein
MMWVIMPILVMVFGSGQTQMIRVLGIEVVFVFFCDFGTLSSQTFFKLPALPLSLPRKKPRSSRLLRGKEYAT